MIAAVAALEQHYDELLNGFRVRESDDYSTLVVPTGNASEPVHRWFHVKEAYSHEFVKRLLKDFGVLPTKRLRVIDPFSGSGTTATSVSDLVREGSVQSAQVLGFESNPFLHLLSTVKTGASSRPVDNFELFAARVVALAETRSNQPIPPGLSTFTNADFFPPAQLNKLLALRDAIDELAAAADPMLRDMARVCLAAAVEPSSRLRRDGRTMRYVSSKKLTDPILAFSNRAQMVADDLSRPVSDYAATVQLGDARDMAREELGESFDAAIFSPPYPNNIDYTEVYKLENWLLGLVHNQEEFSALRRRSLRSHGSLRWEDTYRYQSGAVSRAVDDLLQPLMRCIPDDRYSAARQQLVLGYFDDMLTVLEGCASALKPGGLMACVVGNSMHGKREAPLLVASDLLLAALSELAGLEVVSLEVARRPHRRRTDSSHLRETVVVSRKGPE
jgi:hypothetical protein